ncbi:hypothetical protein CEB3_c00300 [Peptococcaceae bacterium CEB3]|nr:hypothetical protein CEB3_c00300 [Peptococcaceae bacterium CEB3]
MPDYRRGDKAGFDHIAHKEVTDPFGIFAIRFVSFLRFCVLGMCQGNKTGLFKDVEYGNPKLAGRFHTNFDTGEFRKPISQLSKALGKGREASLLILSTAICISNTDAGIDPGFVDIKSTADFYERL